MGNFCLGGAVSDGVDPFAQVGLCTKGGPAEPATMIARDSRPTVQEADSMSNGFMSTFL
jgi:hypothetical protein